MTPTKPRREHYNAAFLGELERLNLAQRRAVDRIEGPVLVIAGPGTGKTHMLSARIGRILLDTDTQANNILCLTFTDAGVRAMRQRLLRLIGPEAHRVHIYTFHSFCNGVIQDNLEYFGRQDLEPISELERIELLRQLIDGLDVAHPLKVGRNDPYYYEQHLGDLFRRMKSENWSPDFIKTCIQDYLSDLPQRPEYTYKVSRGDIRAGDPKTALIEKQEERMQRLRSAAELLPVYEALLRQQRRYDYEDMILWVVRAFTEEEALLRTYQEQYLYLLVDEFQDTNGAQNEILRQLTAYWDSPNIFIVGDDDQSIYEFQGARLHNLIEFYERHADSLDVVLLEDNYRSSQSILDAANQLINRNERRITRQLDHLGIEKTLTARHPEVADLPTLPLVVEYPNRRQEEADIVRQIENLHATGVAWSEMAIIYARHRQAQRLLELLEKKGIPYQTKRRVNVLDTPLIRQLRDLLVYFRLERRLPYSGEPLLFRLLHYRCFGLRPNDLARLSVYRAAIPPGERLAWRELLRQPWRWPEGLELAAELERMGSWLEESMGLLDEMSLPQFIERLVNRGGLLRQATSAPDRLWQVQLLKTFFDFVRQEVERHPRLTLEGLLDTLDRMDANRLAIPLQKQIELENGVQLVTAHSAKGLEFRHVFVLDCTQDYWEPGGRAGYQRFAFPDTITLSGEEDALEARRRLFYVAMTRAQESLQLSYARQTSQGKDVQRSQFIDELVEEAGLTVESRILPAELLLETEILQLTESQPVRLPHLETETVRRLVTNVAISVSDFNRFLRCPLRFFYEVVLQAPHVQSEAATYGLALHQALQRFFDRMSNAPDRAFPTQAELLQLYEREMEHLRAYFSPREYQRRFEQGRRNLSLYYRANIRQWPRQVRTEWRVRQVEVDGVPITGVIDRVDFVDADHAVVVDYKTGSHSDYKLYRPTEANAEGGSYWRQLVFYKLLLDNLPGQTRVVTKGVITYLDADSRNRFPEKEVVFEAADTERLRELLRTTYARIQELDFYEGCGRADCVWCRFVKQDLEVDSFSDPVLEELDDEM